MEANKQSDLRILMFPYLAHGHVFPFLELAKGLAKKHFYIYFCSTPIILESVKLSLTDDEEMSIELVELHLPSLPDLSPHFHTAKNLPPHLKPTLRKAFQMSSSTFTDILTSLKPDLLIYDVMQPWSAKAAASLGIPPVYFATVGSTTLACSHHPLKHKSSDPFPHKAIYLKDFEVRHMRAATQDFKGEITVVGAFELSHDVVLIKSCRALEGKYIDYLSTLCERKIVPTGPLITLAVNQESVDSEIMNWLSEKRDRSTLYISFGSEICLSKDQMGEIAKGLELSGVNFIWVARTPLGSEVSIDDALPEGFLERVKQRGLIIRRWAPQAAILAHRSLGGFMSHCGWSSVTESVYFGVPLVALPLAMDAPFNARLVVEVGVSVEVERDENGEFDSNGVARAVQEVIMEESGEKFRSRARELSEKMKMEEGEAFDEIAHELSKICAKK